MKAKSIILIVILLSIITPTLAGTINASTLAYFPQNQTTWQDLSSHAYAITNAGNVTTTAVGVSAVFKNASYHDGTSKGVLWGIPAIFQQLGTTYPWSLAFRFNASSTNTQSYNCMIGNRNTSGRVDGEFCVGTRSAGSNSIYMNIRYGGGDQLSSSTSTNYNDNAWHYAVVNRTNATNFQIFVDGVKKVDYNVNAATPMGHLQRNFTISHNAVDSNFWTGSLDEIVLYNNTYIPGTAVPTVEFVNAAPAATTPSANFDSSSNPATNNTEVQFTDTSTEWPTEWGWDFGDGNYTSNTTQNPKHLYQAIGTVTVCLNATNAFGSNTICKSQSIVNASGYNNQNIFMEGQFISTVHVTDSSTGIALENVLIQTSDAQAGNTSAAGYANFTHAMGTYAYRFTKEGYDTKTVSIIIDDSKTTEVQMVQSSVVNKNQNIWYSPHQVRLEVWNSYGNKMPNIIINATANQSSMPSNWLTDLYGIEPGVADDMVNNTLIMQATTGGEGAVVFTMHGAISYNIRMTNPQTGAMFFQTLMPKDDQYILRMQTSSVIPNQTTNVYNRLANTSLTFSEPNNSYITMGLQYQDTLGATSSLKFYVYFTDNRTVAYTSNLGNPGTAVALANYTTRNIRGVRYTWNYTAVRS